MILIYHLCRVVVFVGLMVIVTSIVHVVSVHDVLRTWSAAIDEQEEVFMIKQGKDSLMEIARSLCLYGRVVAKYEHLNGNWLYKHVLMGLFLLLPWCVIVIEKKK